MTTGTKGTVQVYVLESGKRYAAPSASIPGFAYEVIVHSQQPGALTCNCKGYEFRRQCKHVVAVQASHQMVTDAKRVEFERKIADLF
jgi:uncharacterized Zn finger protein